VNNIAATLLTQAQSRQRRIVPPSTLMVCPLIHATSSDIKNATIEETSWGWPTRGLRIR
jgi:hypothetical protein